MANDLERAQFWSSFVADQCQYPAADRLKAQLVDAEFYDFCDCGCNSFAVRVSKDAPPLVLPYNGRGSRAIYSADFKMGDDLTLEIILFADSSGNLDYIEVDCCGNSYPVPDHIQVGKPFDTLATDSLLP